MREYTRLSATLTEWHSAKGESGEGFDEKGPPFRFDAECRTL